MKTVLIIGSGGREHALGWRLAQDRPAPRLWFAPGNAGTATLGTNLPLAADAVRDLAVWAHAHRPDLVVVGPEAPLCAGLTDLLQADGIAAFGPSQAGARLEGSKAFAKAVMREAGVATALSTPCDRIEDARRAIDALPEPLVVKADGLAAGKGVFVCDTRADAHRALEALMEARCFGDAGDTVVVEEFLNGQEASLLALVDGEQAVMLPAAQDHKRAFDGDLGPNTGGMGAYSPTPIIPSAMSDQVLNSIVMPVIETLLRRGIRYRGVLYTGLMLTAEGPKVLEFNCRFGDPETQVILPRLAGDLLPLLDACARGSLSRIDPPSCLPDPCVGVVMASGGYPGNYRKGLPIAGLDSAAAMPGIQVFHAGTAMRNQQVVTDGGRVLNVVALGKTLAEGLERAYRAVRAIEFEGACWRRDIAHRAL